MAAQRLRGGCRPLVAALYTGKDLRHGGRGEVRHGDVPAGSRVRHQQHQAQCQTRQRQEMRRQADGAPAPQLGGRAAGALQQPASPCGHSADDAGDAVDEPRQHQQRRAEEQTSVAVQQHVADTGEARYAPQHHHIEPHGDQTDEGDAPQYLTSQLLVQHLVERLLVGVQLRCGGVVAAVDVQIRCQVADVFPAHLPVGGDTRLFVGVPDVPLYVDAVAHSAGRVLPEGHGGAEARLQREKPLLCLFVQPVLDGVHLIEVVGDGFQHGGSSSPRTASASRRQRRRRATSLSYSLSPASVVS